MTVTLRGTSVIIRHPHEFFFSSGLSGENAPVHRQRLAFAASVRSKKKKKKKKVRRRTDKALAAMT